MHTSTHSGGIELTRLAYNTMPEDTTWYATGAVRDIEPVAPVVFWGFTRALLLLILALVLELNNNRFVFVSVVGYKYLQKYVGKKDQLQVAAEIP